MKWNRSDHRRKFLEVDGRYMRRGKARLGSIRFWGEWEAASQATSVSKPVKNGPRYIHRPYFQVPKEYRGLQNTDPFVFGGFFLHRLPAAHGRGADAAAILRTRLRHIIWFVRRWEVCGRQRFCRGGLDRPQCADLSQASQSEGAGCILGRDFASLVRKQRGRGVRKNHDEATSYRLYFGATVEKPFDGMFSYVPCKPAVQSLRKDSHDRPLRFRESLESICCRGSPSTVV